MNVRDAALALGTLLIGALPRASAAQIPPSLEFRVPKPPTVAAVGDSMGSAVYELHVTNLSSDTLSLKRIEAIRDGDGRTLLVLEDSALLRAIARPGSPTRADLMIPFVERAKLGGGLRAVIYLWVRVDRANPPTAIRHRLTFERTGASSSPIVIEGATIPVSSSIAQIGPPLRGEWLAANGPSNSSGHRRTVMGLNGSIAIAQRFAIDFLRVDEKDQTTRSDRSSNDNFYAENQDVISVADGVVVDTKDSIPENPVGGRAVPITLITVGGNYIVTDIGNGRYAFYAHLKPGSQRVKVGDRVRRGQVLGLVGNSGNSTEPHLHFHIADAIGKGTSTLAAEGLPYALDRMEVLGSCAVVAAIGPCTRNAPVVLRNAMPGQNQLVRFPTEAPPQTQALDYSAPAGAPYTAEDVTITTPMGHTLAGTLTLPRGASRTRPVGAVVTVSGSGRQDRDSGMPTIGNYRAFRQYADSLGRRGIAVLRMDDRGTFGSKGTFAGSTSADFAEDIRAGVAYLRTRAEIAPKKIAVLGHSEGALIAPMVAAKEPDLRAIVLLAGVARPAREVLIFQMTNLINHNERYTQTQKDSAIADIPARIDRMMAADTWMDFFLKHDPSALARTVKNPAVLILTGANDQQADPKQAPVWAEAFRASGNRDVTVQILPGLNHLFVNDPDGFPGNYAKLPPPIRVEPHVVGMVVEWLVRRLR